MFLCNVEIVDIENRCCVIWFCSFERQSTEGYLSDPQKAPSLCGGHTMCCLASSLITVGMMTVRRGFISFMTMYFVL